MIIESENKLTNIINKGYNLNIIDLLKQTLKTKNYDNFKIILNINDDKIIENTINELDENTLYEFCDKIVERIESFPNEFNILINWLNKIIWKNPINIEEKYNKIYFLFNHKLQNENKIFELLGKSEAIIDKINSFKNIKNENFENKKPQIVIKSKEDKIIDEVISEKDEISSEEERIPQIDDSISDSLDDKIEKGLLMEEDSFEGHNNNMIESDIEDDEEIFN